MAADSNFDSVTLLLHCDGTDGSTTFTDSSQSAHAVTVSGNAHVEVDQYKFGTASAAFDGSGDYLNCGFVGMGSDDFTLECWVRFSALGTGNRTLFSQYGSAQAARTILDVRNTKLSIFSGNNGVQYGTTTIVTNTWYHIAFVRQGTTCKGYLDGVLELTHTTFQTPYSTNTLIGSYPGASGDELSGYMDDIRLTNGVARYTSNFTPPSAAFPNIAGYIAGTVLDDAGDPVARVLRAYRRDTGVLVGSTTSSAGDGSYSIDSTTLTECSVLCLDDAGGDDFNDLVLRVTPA